MANQNSLYQKDNVAQFPSNGFILDYCPNSPDTKHAFIQQEYEPGVKQCFWCALLVLPDDK